MTRVQAVNERYTKSAELVRDGVEIVAVVDIPGSRLNSAIRSLRPIIAEDGPDIWEELAGAAKGLRWRVMTQPQPIELNPAVTEACDHVLHQTSLLRAAVGSRAKALLDELAEAARAVTESDSELAPILLQLIEEVGADDCVVIAANGRAQDGLQNWLSPRGVKVLTESRLLRGPLNVQQAYVVGPPRFFRPSLVNAPMTSAVTFLIPTWFADHSLPSRAMSKYSEDLLQISVRFFTEGQEPEIVSGGDDQEVEEDFIPSPVWTGSTQPAREPGNDEVVARKVLLGGGHAIWLDDGERIRSLDLEQPIGARVTYTDVRDVRPGVFLLLRQGETERDPLYQDALKLLGVRGKMADASQKLWKDRLTQRIANRGFRMVVGELHEQGVKAAERARAWTAPNLVRPHNDRDFEALLQWLDLPIQPSFTNATALRRSLYRASVEIGDELEAAADLADLTILDRDGFLSLSIARSGFRGIIATRVLAISPHTEIVRRHDARLPFDEKSPAWLE